MYLENEIRVMLKRKEEDSQERHYTWEVQICRHVHTVFATQSCSDVEI